MKNVGGSREKTGQSPRFTEIPVFRGCLWSQIKKNPRLDNALGERMYQILGHYCIHFGQGIRHRYTSKDKIPTDVCVKGIESHSCKSPD